MEIMREYGIEQNTAHLISHHWYNHRFVTNASMFIGMDFVTGRGVMQGNPSPLLVFNIMVDVVMRVVLEVVCGPQEAQNRMGWVAVERNLVLYTDDGRILLRDKIWV